MKLPPGDYCAPYAGSMEAMKSPAFAEKIARGPVVMMTVKPGGSMSMGAQLAQWFVYSVVISVFAAYVTGRVLTGPQLPAPSDTVKPSKTRPSSSASEKTSTVQPGQAVPETEPEMGPLTVSLP